MTPIEKLARVRGESLAETEAYLARLAHEIIPPKLIDPDRLSRLPVAASGLEGPYSFIRLKDGRTFYGFPSSPRRLQQYWMIKDKLSTAIRPHAFATALDAQKRYFQADLGEIDAPDGAVVVEAGAYIGFKAMRYAEAVGAAGRVIAVEINAANCALMQHNLDANGIGNVVAVNAGLWSERCTMTAGSGGYQRQSLVKVGRIGETASQTVDCLRIADLIEAHGLDRVDFLNVQVNGAELEVLKGCEPYLDRIRRIGINSKYVANGEEIAPLVVEWLESRGRSVNYRQKRRIISDK